MTVPRTDEPLALKVTLPFKLVILSTWSWNLDMLVFEERGKLQGYPEKKNRQEKQQKTQHTKCVEPGTRTHATIVGVGALTS